ncbi:MAG: element excision factor XisI family protein [Chloroflexota bacterium]
MDTLSDTLAAVMAGYAGRDLNGESFLTRNEDRTVLTILSVGNLRGQHFAVTSLAVRLVDEHIVIEHDLNDRPLVDALVAAGVPRGEIVLAYAGESGTHAA